MKRITLAAFWLVPGLRRHAIECIEFEKKLLQIRAVSGLSESDLKPLVEAVGAQHKSNPNPPSRTELLDCVREFLTRGGTLDEAIAALKADGRWGG